MNQMVNYTEIFQVLATVAHRDFPSSCNCRTQGFSKFLQLPHTGTVKYYVHALNLGVEFKFGTQDILVEPMTNFLVCTGLPDHKYLDLLLQTS